jgi:hypothetical protein
MSRVKLGGKNKNWHVLSQWYWFHAMEKFESLNNSIILSPARVGDNSSSFPYFQNSISNPWLLPSAALLFLSPIPVLACPGPFGKMVETCPPLFAWCP